MFFLVRLFIALGFEILCTGFTIDRPSKKGDFFSKRMNLLNKTINSCSTKGSGFSQSSGSGCKCNWGQTFFVDKDVPKCIAGYGQDIKDGLDCAFRFNGLYNIKEVTPSRLTKTYDLGEVYYNYNRATNHDLDSVLYWNMTWKTVEESQLFYFNKKHLKWTISNSKALALKYSGLLFKLDIKADVNRNQQESCLLLKLTGSRNYPLPDPNKSKPTSSIKTIPSSSIVTPPKTSSKVSNKLPSSSSLFSPKQTPSSSPSKQILTTSTKMLVATSSSKRKLTSRVIPSKHTPSTFSSKQIPSTSSASKLIPTASTLVTSSSQMTTSLKSSITMSTSTTSIISSSSLTSSDHKTIKTLLPSPSPSPSRVSKFQGKSQSIGTSIVERTSRISVKTSTVNDKSNLSPPVKTASHSSSTTVPTSTPTTNVNGNVGQQKESGSNTATIAGIAVGAVVAICVFGVVFFLYRRKYATKTESRKRKETMMLNLTSNTYSNNYNADTTRNGNATQKDLGNPMYDDKLMLGKEAKRPACNAYENRGPDLVSEPIYKEVEDEQPVYEETGDMYQPLSKNKPAVLEQDIYQPIDASSLSKSAQQVESPIYQVLDDPTAEEARSQSPIYHTVEAEDYQAIDRSGVQNNEGFYAELNDGKPQAPLQEPLYRELDNSVEGQVNVKYDDDEEAI